MNEYRLRRVFIGPDRCRSLVYDRLTVSVTAQASNTLWRKTRYPQDFERDWYLETNRQVIWNLSLADNVRIPFRSLLKRTLNT